MRQVVSDGGWMPMRSAVIRIRWLPALEGW